MRDDLEQVSAFIATPVRLVMTASIVTFTADSFFRGIKRSFARNPANTLPHIALGALEDRSIVDIAEVIHTQGLIPEGAIIRRKAELLAHRHALSHPMTVKWRQSRMQAFFDERSQWRDLRPALVWDLQQSLNEELRKAGGATLFNETIEVGEPMAAMLETILKLSLADPARVPPASELVGDLRAFKDDYLAYLLEHPDGKPPARAGLL